MKKRPGFPAKVDFGQDHHPPSTQLSATKVLASSALSHKVKVPINTMPSGIGLDSAKVRERMVQKLALQGLEDEWVLKAMGKVERHRFVDTALVNQAYEDTSLPIGLGQTISKPSVVARMIELLHEGVSGKLGRVLEIGTGCGYQAAVLALLGARVYTVERRQPLLAGARERFAGLGLDGIACRLGDGTRGWPEEAPFDRILVTAGAAGREPPPALLEQLGPDGILVIPLGDDRWQQRLVRIRRSGPGFLREESWPVRFVPLVADPQADAGETPGV